MADDRAIRFERVVLPHLDSAYNLARWFTGRDEDAQDVVQEACLRALKALDDLRGADGRCWLLAIVRNAYYSAAATSAGSRGGGVVSLDDGAADGLCAREADDPLRAAVRGAEVAGVREAIAGLPAEFREVVILRELEGLSYKEIAAVAGVPVGTVMSRLARARARLQERLAPAFADGGVR